MLDEITAALPADLSERVFAVVREWRGSGKSVIFISHRMAEVAALCDRATVLRDGVTVGVTATKGAEESIVSLMLGSEVAKERRGAGARARRRRRGRETPALEVRGLELWPCAPRRLVRRRARRGARRRGALRGRARRSCSIASRACGEPTRAKCWPKGSCSNCAIPPTRSAPASCWCRPIGCSLAAAATLDPRERRAGRFRADCGLGADRDGARSGGGSTMAVRKLQIDTRAAAEVRRLSGGNKQKVVIARWLAAGFRTLLCFDPTRGIDIGTKRQIYALLREIAAQGAVGAALHLRTARDPPRLRPGDRAVRRPHLRRDGRRRKPTRRACCAPRTGSRRRGRGGARHERSRRLEPWRHAWRALARRRARLLGMPLLLAASLLRRR